MEEKVIEFLSSPYITSGWILAVAFFFQYIENLFPPSPSDVVLLFLGSLVGFDKVNFLPLLIVATIGSSAGFLTMFLLGKIFGERILDAGRFKFINPESLEKTRNWFNRWGYGIVVANRFLSGTRAVISFFAGLAKLSTWKSTILATVSALVWNFLILYAGMALGNNWRSAIRFLELYWKVVLILIFIVALGYFIYTRWKKNNSRG
ncbi:DedA family protein [Bacteroidetes/Chlorobi group bacterium Naka2016]|jgi:membrane protein DedA with SNARE-associated domain|nr:MAG: DedA family protein [Bacteroidetes/Chlorobi group bacterium Naka2016]